MIVPRTGLAASRPSGGLPTPWLDDSANFDVATLLQELERARAAPDSPHDHLTIALTRAQALAGRDGDGAGTTLDPPWYVRHAQAVLEIAVEWHLPAVERWAVAWLAAAGQSHFRLRWSSRARDGRLTRYGRASGLITAIAGDSRALAIGTDSGVIERWTAEGGRERLGDLGSRVWTVVQRGERVFAAGEHARFCAIGWGGSPYPELPAAAGIVCAAIGENDWIACGDEVGKVQICRADGKWIPLPTPPVEARAMGVFIYGRGDEPTVRCVWRSGLVSEWTEGSGQWQVVDRFDSEIVVAAWDDIGRLAVGIAGSGDVRLMGRSTPLWCHPGIRAAAWSPDGLLATAGSDQKIMIGDPRLGSHDLPAGGAPEVVRLADDAAVEGVAFLDTRYLVSFHHAELAHWDLNRSGSDDPSVDEGGPITAIGTDPEDRGRTATGTRLGLLREYNGQGLLVHSVSAQSRCGTVHQLVRHGGRWLVASETGAYLWDPDKPGAELKLERLNPRLCHAVASRGKTCAYAGMNEVHSSDDRRRLKRLTFYYKTGIAFLAWLTGQQPGFTMVGGLQAAKRLTFDTAVPVRDICLGADGSLVAIDAEGNLAVCDVDGHVWPQRAVGAGARLLDIRPDGVVVQGRDGGVWLYCWDGWDGRPYGCGQVPGDSKVVAVPDTEMLAVHAPDGVMLLGPEPDRAVRALGQMDYVSAGSQLVVASAGSQRVVASAGVRLVGYDVVETGTNELDGVVTLHAKHVDTDWQVQLPFPGSAPVRLPSDELEKLRTCASSDNIDPLSQAIWRGGTLGDRLWQAGLDRAIDQARGPYPDRRVRIEWVADDDSADLLPLELLHPSTEPLCWFGDPPVTMVRASELSTSDPCDDDAGGGERRRGRPRMLVVRGSDEIFNSVDETFDRIRRRTRRSYVDLVNGGPMVISSPNHLKALESKKADIVQVWAHCGPDEVKFCDKVRPSIEEFATVVTAMGPRLVVLIGCESGALGRVLINRGVAAVVAMRTEVYHLTIQPLVEDLTALVLAGEPVDLAFAEALRRYVLTGQPGAAAVPMLYLNPGSTGVLFHK